jgi:hypothetical protein
MYVADVVSLHSDTTLALRTGISLFRRRKDEPICAHLTNHVSLPRSFRDLLKDTPLAQVTIDILTNARKLGLN